MDSGEIADSGRIIFGDLQDVALQSLLLLAMERRLRRKTASRGQRRLRSERTTSMFSERGRSRIELVKIFLDPVFVPTNQTFRLCENIILRDSTIVWTRVWLIGERIFKSGLLAKQTSNSTSDG